MSGDDFYGAQPLKFYAQEMTETKKITLSHFEKKLFPESNSVIHLKRKYQEIKAPATFWKAKDAA